MKGLIAVISLIVSVSGCTTSSISNKVLPSPVQTDDTLTWSMSNVGNCGPNIISEFDFVLTTNGDWQAQIRFFSIQKLGAPAWQSQISIIVESADKTTKNVNLILNPVSIAPKEYAQFKQTGSSMDAARLLQKQDKISNSKFMLRHQCQRETA